MRRARTTLWTGKCLALVAGGAILLLIVQGLLASLASSSLETAAADGPSFSRAAGPQICLKDAAGDPAHDARHGHEGCCILCEPGAREAALVFLAAWTATSAAPLPVVGASGADYSRLEEVRPKPAGWASSWSSRAPPFFS